MEVDLGTGRGSDDKLKASAMAFLDSYLIFCGRKDTHKGLTVHLVCHEETKMQVVNRVLFNHVRGVGQSGSPPQRPPLPAVTKGQASASPPITSSSRSAQQLVGNMSPSAAPISQPTTAHTGAYRNTGPPTINYQPVSQANTRDTVGGSISSDPQHPLATQKDEDTNDNCVICMDVITNPKSLKCGHKFCTDCIDESFKHKKVCPMCGAVCGIITGNQPRGTVVVHLAQNLHCAGYESVGQLQITYNFPNGYQGKEHPSPGKPYRGITRTGLLPENEKGRMICEMLQLAFERRLVFTIGDSRTTGREGVITWNDIHHKTDIAHGAQFGYPDAGYLDRVIDELAAKGITKADVSK